MKDGLVADVGFVAFVGDVADEVEPGDGVGACDEVGVGDGAEGFTYIGCVGYVAVGGEEDCADAGGVAGRTSGQRWFLVLADGVVWCGVVW